MNDATPLEEENGPKSQLLGFRLSLSNFCSIAYDQSVLDKTTVHPSLDIIQAPITVFKFGKISQTDANLVMVVTLMLSSVTLSVRELLCVWIFFNSFTNCLDVYW